MTSVLHSAINSLGHLVFLVEGGTDSRAGGAMFGPDLERLTFADEYWRGVVSGRKYQLVGAVTRKE